MNHTIRIDFRDESGAVLAGELVNSYRLVESATSRSGIGVEIDQIRDGEIDMLVFCGDEMQAHRVTSSQIIAADEVFV